MSKYLQSLCSLTVDLLSVFSLWPPVQELSKSRAVLCSLSSALEGTRDRSMPGMLLQGCRAGSCEGILEGIVNISNYKYPKLCCPSPSRIFSYKLLCLAVPFTKPSDLFLGLVFQFSCCCLKLNTSQGHCLTLVCPCSHESKDTPYQPCFYNCVVLA